MSAVGSAAEAAWPLLLATPAAAVAVELDVSRDRVLSMHVLNMPQTHSIYIYEPTSELNTLTLCTALLIDQPRCYLNTLTHVPVPDPVS